MIKDIKILDRQSYPENIVIIEQGTAGSRAYIIESGKVEVSIKDPSGKIIIITTLGPGALIGEIALIDDGLRTASVRTIEATVLVNISAHDFLKSLRKSGTLKTNLIGIMGKRLKETLDVLEEERPIEKIKDQNIKEISKSFVDKLKSTLIRLTRRV